MTLLRTVDELRAALQEQRAGGVALVPTMGALHDGHLSLVRAAAAEHACVVVSVFVNPTQFTDAQDLAAYPRDEERDVELARSAGARFVFAPSVEEMYPQGFATSVHVSGAITETLEGAMRGSEHFTGMATIVTKLLLAALPDAAYFGAKDAQQTVVVRRLVADLGIPSRIVICPTSRDEDGLARSSRNVRLSTEERARALAVPESLRLVERAVAQGERKVRPLEALAAERCADAGLEVEYLACVDPDSLEPVSRVERPTLFLVAVRAGGVRLIDNVLLAPPGAE